MHKWLGIFAVILLTDARAQTARPFTMSTTAIQALPGQSPFYQNHSAAFSFQTMGADADVISLFPEYLGVPFDAFAATSVLPVTDPWSVQMTALATAAKATGKPLMLQLVLSRDTVVARAANVAGKLSVQPGWVKSCADLTTSQYATLADAYVNYATWMAKTFAPKYMVVAVEANLYYAVCGGNTPTWQLLVATERRAYDAVKAVNSAIIAFPSFKLETLYGQTFNGFDQTQYAAMSAMKRDRLGIATYPYSIPVGSGFANPYQLPVDYLVRIRNRNPAEPRIVITETGWNSTGISVLSKGTCFGNFVYSEPAFQSAFMELLLYSAYVYNFDHVSWWSDRDLIPSTVMTSCYPASAAPYPECNGDLWCQSVNAWRNTNVGWTSGYAELAFKAFGTLGLRQYNGTANLATTSLWMRFLKLPVAGN